MAGNAAAAAVRAGNVAGRAVLGVAPEGMIAARAEVAGLSAEIVELQMLQRELAEVVEVLAGEEGVRRPPDSVFVGGWGERGRVESVDGVSLSDEAGLRSLVVRALEASATPVPVSRREAVAGGVVEELRRLGPERAGWRMGHGGLEFVVRDGGR